MPYMTPKFTVLAMPRCSDVGFVPAARPKTLAAVRAWMSSPRWNASTSAGSREKCAIRRSSICE